MHSFSTQFSTTSFKGYYALNTIDNLDGYRQSPTFKQIMLQTVKKKVICNSYFLDYP